MKLKVLSLLLCTAFIATAPSFAATKTVSTGRYIGGGLAGTFLGFGIGHAIQSRYSEKGWIFTLGEGLGIAGMVAGQCIAVATVKPGQVATITGAGVGAVISTITGSLVYSVFHIWEIVDVWVGVDTHDSKTADLKDIQKDKWLSQSYEKKNNQAFVFDLVSFNF